MRLTDEEWNRVVSRNIKDGILRHCMANRQKRLDQRIWDEAVEGKHITVFADGKLIGELNIDFKKESQHD